jgi:hypothetical protein
MNTQPLKIRASKAGCLMTEPRNKSDKDAGNLSETAKTYLRELWIEKTYNRRKDITNKFIEKGLLNEETSIDFASLLHNELYEKNEKLYASDYFTGTPDIISGEYIIDIKSSFDIFTFAKAELTDLYYHQLNVYMELTGLRKSKLIYCLTDAPEATIQRELKTAQYKLQVTELPELEAKLRKEMCYSDIPLDKKVKVFEIEYSEADIKKLQGKVEKAREYFAGLTL